jgi:hypothetical protein
VRSRDPKVTVGGVLQDRRPPGAGGAVAAKTGHPAPDREAAVGMPTDDDPGAGTGGMPELPGQLQTHRVEAHRVVGGDDPLLLFTEDLVEIDVAQQLFINLKTAKALGLTIPPSLLLRADELTQ